jgi:hypothetical protein
MSHAVVLFSAEESPSDGVEESGLSEAGRRNVTLIAAAR